MKHFDDSTLESLVPISLIATEVGESVGWVLKALGDSVTVDHAGMRAVPVEVCAEFLDTRAEEERKRKERRARRQAEIEAKREPVTAGPPAQDGMTAAEVVMSSPGWVSPADEFEDKGKGHVHRQLMEERLAEGRRLQAERKRKAREATRRREGKT